MRTVRRPLAYHQGALLRQALAERGEAREFALDHWNGRARTATGDVGLVYPDSFFDRTAALMDSKKTMRFAFCGDTGPGRSGLLARFSRAHPETVIVSSAWARSSASKGTFDPTYYSFLAHAEFGLCPHHETWPGDPDTMWTYRFAECCMVGAIPVLFRATPLSSRFVRGFLYVWDDDAAFTYAATDAKQNRALAEERFRLP